MAFSKDKAFDRAERYAAKGQHDKAAREYQTIVDNDPKEIRAWLMLADCLVRTGDGAAAIERYLQVGQYYIQQKDHQKALAVYRQVLNLDASRLDVQLRVAALNRELGRTQDAIAMYERVGTQQLQMGQSKDALATFKMVAEADPTTVSRRLRLAELYSRERNVAEAVESFRMAGSQLIADGRKADYVRVAERLLYHDAADYDTVRQLAAVYLELGDPRRALMKLNALLQVDSKDTAGLELLARTFMALGKPDKAVSVVTELARELRAQGPDDLDACERVLEQGLAWSPGHPELTEQLRQLQGQRPAPAPTGLQITAPAQPADDLGISEVDEADVVELDEGDVVLEDAESIDSEPISIDPVLLDPSEPHEVGAPEVTLDGPGETVEVDAPVQPAATPMTRSVLSEAADAEGGEGEPLTDFDKILFEARVYIKYRLFEHALDHVRQAVSQQPNHVGALSLLARALGELGRGLEAAQAHVQVAGLVRDADPKLAREHLSAATSLVPGHPEALELIAQLNAEESAPYGQPQPQPQPLDQIDSDVLRVETAGEPSANLLDIDHAPQGVAETEPDEEDSDFTIEVEQPEAEEMAAAPAIEIEDRFGLEPGPYEDEVHVTAEYGAPDAEPVADVTTELVDSPLLEQHPTEEQPAIVLNAGTHAGAAPSDADLLGAEASAFGDMEEEDSVDAPGSGLALLEPSIDDDALELTDHSVQPMSSSAPVEEPDLLALSLGVPGEEAAEAAVEADEDSRTRVAVVPEAGAPRLDEGAPPAERDAAPAPAAVEDLPEPEPEPEAAPPAAEPAPDAASLEPAPIAAASTGEWPDLSDDLAEIRFYTDQGLDDDAEAAMADLRRRYPGHPELTPEPDGVPEETVPVDTGAAAPLVSLSDADEDEDEDEDAYLDAIFSEPAPEKEKKASAGARVASANVDPQTAFDLGVAYREMGLVDEAVVQFEAAAQDGSMRVRALVMLGTLRVHQGDTNGAVAHLQEAVQLATTAEELAEANYELGVLYEKLGDTRSAIEQLQAVETGYRDRDERLSALQG